MVWSAHAPGPAPALCGLTSPLRRGRAGTGAPDEALDTLVRPKLPQDFLPAVAASAQDLRVPLLSSAGSQVVLEDASDAKGGLERIPPADLTFRRGGTIVLGSSTAEAAGNEIASWHGATLMASGLMDCSVGSLLGLPGNEGAVATARAARGRTSSLQDCGCATTMAAGGSSAPLEPMVAHVGTARADGAGFDVVLDGLACPCPFTLKARIAAAVSGGAGDPRRTATGSGM
jgi:hypothetical protein